MLTRPMSADARRLGLAAIVYLRRQLRGEVGPVARLCGQGIHACPACDALTDPRAVAALPAGSAIDAASVIDVRAREPEASAEGGDALARLAVAFEGAQLEPDHDEGNPT
jgi:hypothetical protein